MQELAELQEDTESAEVFRKAHKIAMLDGKWREALDSIQSYIDTHPGAARRGALMLDEIEAKWLEKRRALFHRAKCDEMERAIEKFLLTRSPDLDVARSWVASQLEDEIRQRLRERFGMTSEEIDAFAGSKTRSSPHWAGYDNGSFVLSERARRGQSTKRQIRGDPNRWWAGYGNQDKRNWLKAYAAERLKIIEVVRVITVPCRSCGGTGQVTKSSSNSLSDGRHEWQELCPRCYGACEDRSIGYR
jgi:hypothetical protein